MLRRHASTGGLTAQQANAAIDDLLAFPITVYPLRRCYGECGNCAQT